MNDTWCCGIDTHDPCSDCPLREAQAAPAKISAQECRGSINASVAKDKVPAGYEMHYGKQTEPARPVTLPPAVPDIRANVEGFLLYIQGYQDALDIFSSMLEEVIGE